MKQSISIQDLAARYCEHSGCEDQSYLCHFITASLSIGNNVDVQDTLRIQWCTKFNIDQDWAGRRGTILEQWNMDCIDFDDISVQLSTKQYRVACLNLAAHLHPDWILEF